MSHLEISEAILVHCIIVNNHYQHVSEVLYTFVPKKLLSQSLDISPKKVILLKTFSSEFLYVEVCFTDNNSKPLEQKTYTFLFINFLIKRVICKN